MSVPWLVALVLPCALLLQACPSCPFEEQCAGNVLKTCFVGVDQLVGSADEGEHVCASPNPSCITLDDKNALCGIAPERSCAESALPRCEAGLLVSCQEGFEVAYDCVAHGNVCATIDGKGRCRRDPPTTCVPEQAQRCEGNLMLSCDEGFITAVDCSVQVEGGRCDLSVSEPSRFVFCREP